MDITFQAFDWASIEPTEHLGESGTAFWRTIQLPGLRIRLVEYSAGYVADHWCKKGHIVHCIEGEFINEMEHGELRVFLQGMCYIVSDNLSTHRSFSENGAKLFIVDGDFLK